MRPILVPALFACCAALSGQEDPQTLARQVVAQVAWARQNPQAAAAELKTWLPRFEEGRYLAFPGEPRLRTQEGPAAVEEAIAFLERQTPLRPVAWSDRLARAARDLAADQARHGGLGHQASDGSHPWERVARYGTVSGSMGEVVAYGSFGEPGDPRRAVLTLIVDDGVPDRGHRTVIFDGGFTRAGAAWGPHPIYTRMAVVDFASGFLRDLEPRPSAPRRGELAQGMLTALNAARRDPKGCAAELRAWLAGFSSTRVLSLPGERPLQTREGPAAVREAIALLEAHAPAPPVWWSEDLAACAAERVASQSDGGPGHRRPGKPMDLASRLARHGGLNSPCGEALAYGTFGGPEGPRRALLAMLVGDGEGDRRILRLLLDPGVASLGAAWGTHPVYGDMVVLDVSGRLASAPR